VLRDFAEEDRSSVESFRRSRRKPFGGNFRVVGDLPAALASRRRSPRLARSNGVRTSRRGIVRGWCPTSLRRSRGLPAILRSRFGKAAALILSLLDDEGLRHRMGNDARTRART
jgi:hypothetical protein